MAITDDIVDIYSRLNSSDKQMSMLIGKVDTLIATQQEYVHLVKLLTKFLFIITMMSLSALIVGAVGEKGLFTVRTMVTTCNDNNQISDTQKFCRTPTQQTTMEV